MIGSDEKCAYDRDGNVAFVSSRQDGIDGYLAQVATLGFAVEGTTVMATKREIEVALFAKRPTDAYRAQVYKDYHRMGRAAFRSGADINACPVIAVGSTPYEGWVGGWNEAKADWQDRER